MSRKHLFLLFPIVLTGCDTLASLLLDELTLLGVTPAPGFSDESSADYGVATFAVGGFDPDGVPVAPIPDEVEVEPDEGEVDYEDGEDRPGFSEGSFVLLVDGSASLLDTDPARVRVEAAVAMAQALHECAPDTRMALMEFGNGRPSQGFEDTTILADYTTDTEALVAAAEELRADGWTPLWDATIEVVESLDQDAEAEFEGSVGRGLVVVSDGEDTKSTSTLQQAVDAANGAGIAVNTVGLGPASDIADERKRVPAAITGLRTLATDTMGYYGSAAQPDDLPALAEAIAGSWCGGYAEVRVRFTDPPESGEPVTGTIGIKDTDIGVPWTFTAP